MIRGLNKQPQRAIGALAALIVIGFLTKPAHAQARIPTNSTQAFMKWCAARGVTTKDSKGVTCLGEIGVVVAVVYLVGECDNIEHRNAERRIHEWLRANPQRARGSLTDAIDAALFALFGC